MKTFLLTIIYACIGVAILGLRLAFEFLNSMELIYYLVSVLVISITGTIIHRFFEYLSHKTGETGENSFSFMLKMIIISIVASLGVYILISYISSGGIISIGYDAVYYVIVIPCLVLFAIWMYFKIMEQEYNKKLSLIKKEKNK